MSLDSSSQVSSEIRLIPPVTTPPMLPPAPGIAIRSSRARARASPRRSSSPSGSDGSPSVALVETQTFTSTPRRSSRVTWALLRCA